MSLTAAEVAEIMRLVEQSSFDELTLEMDGVKLSLRRGAAVQMNGSGGMARSSEPGSPQSPGGSDGRSDSTGRDAGGSGMRADAAFAGYPAVTPSAARSGEVAPSVARASATGGTSSASATHHALGGAPALKPLGANQHDVVSPLLGTFYRAPKPGAPPFVEVGATVEEDTVIAIIEVMKLMNTVRAGVRGTVADIFVADGALVEFEQPLIRVSKTG